MAKRSCWRTDLRSGLTLSAAALAIPAAPALAQAPDPAAGEETVAAAEPADPADGETIVVTARKREERLIDVPISISVVTGPALERAGIQDVDGLYGRIPSLFYSINNSRTGQKDQTYLVLRGVGANPVLEPSVGVFIDGIYQPSVGFDIGFLDLDRVEVLRGPQGALFGRNTEGGAMSVITRKPGREFVGRVSGELSNFPSGYLRGSVSGPVSEDVSAGVALQFSGTDGFVRNTTLGDHQDDSRAITGRVALRYRPGNATDINLTVDKTRKRGSTVGPGVLLSDGSVYRVTDDFDGPFRDDQWGSALTIEQDFGELRLTSLTGYRDLDTRYGFDADGTGAFTGNIQNAFTKQTLLSEEVRLGSNGDGPVSWLAGVYLFRQRDDTRTLSSFETLFGPPTATVALRSDQLRKGYAVFGQANYEAIPDTLDVSAALRYSKERVNGERRSFLDIPSFGLTRLVTGSNKGSFKDVSPSLQATLTVAPRVRAYASVAKGFKAGGFEKFPSSTDPYLPIPSEKSWNYEAGLKGSAGRFDFTAAVYQIDIRDLQLPTLVIDPDTGLPSTRIDSAGKARNRGFELELVLRPAPGVSLNGSLAHVDAKFRDFIDADGDQRAGDRVPNVPRWSWNAGASVERPLSGDWSWVASGSARHIASFVTGIGTSGDPQFEIKRYTLVDADLGLQNGRYSVGLFVRNAFDKYYVTNIADFLIGFGPQRQVGEPRSYGIRAAVDF